MLRKTIFLSLDDKKNKKENAKENIKTFSLGFSLKNNEENKSKKVRENVREIFMVSHLTPLLHLYSPLLELLPIHLFFQLWTPMVSLENLPSSCT